MRHLVFGSAGSEEHDDTSILLRLSCKPVGKLPGGSTVNSSVLRLRPNRYLWMVTLFAVERSEQDGGPLVIEAAVVVAAAGWWAFRNDDGHTLKTLPTAAVRGIETVQSRRPWPGRINAHHPGLALQRRRPDHPHPTADVHARTAGNQRPLLRLKARQRRLTRGTGAGRAGRGEAPTAPLAECRAHATAADSVACSVSGPGPGLPAEQRTGRTNSYRGEGRSGPRFLLSATKSGAVPMALFAVKRQGHDTMLVVEAATAEAADGWLVFRSADGQPLASLRVEEVLGLETVAPGGAGPHPEPSSWRPMKSTTSGGTNSPGASRRPG